jgi:hypothetical protein
VVNFSIEELTNTIRVHIPRLEQKLGIVGSSDFLDSLREIPGVMRVARYQPDVVHVVVDDCAYGSTTRDAVMYHVWNVIPSNQ